MHESVLKDFGSFGCRKGVATDRLVGFQDLGGKDDFSTKTLEILLTKKGGFSIGYVILTLSYVTF